MLFLETTTTNHFVTYKNDDIGCNICLIHTINKQLKIEFTLLNSKP